MRMQTLFAVALFGVLATGCPTPPSRAARMQEAANEFNANARFGRMELVVERVSNKERDAFLRRHKAWGSQVRIADLEVSSMRLLTDDTAEVTVRVGWYRPEQGELRSTLLKQRWRDYRGDWMLVGEEKADGDPGLLGEQVMVEMPPRTTVQFPTVRIGE